MFVVIFQADDQLTDVASAQHADKGFRRPLQAIEDVLTIADAAIGHAGTAACTARAGPATGCCSSYNAPHAILFLPYKEGQPKPRRWRRFEVLIPLQ